MSRLLHSYTNPSHGLHQFCVVDQSAIAQHVGTPLQLLNEVVGHARNHHVGNVYDKVVDLAWPGHIGDIQFERFIDKPMVTDGRAW